MQAADDPSLVISSEQAWNARGRKASVFKKRNIQAREFILASLGRASGLCPRIEASLKTALPTGYGLDNSGANEFLTEKAPALEQAGFGVMLPAWWTRKGTKIRISAQANVKSPKMHGSGKMGLDEIIKFDWQIALGGDELSLEELEALARLKSPLVNIRGQWVQMNAEEIQAAIDFWKNKASSSASVRDIMKMAIGSLKPPAAIEFEGVKATGWISKLVDKMDGKGKMGELSSPDGFCGTLRPYQVKGYSWLAFLRQWGLGACLADDMGLAEID